MPSATHDALPVTPNRPVSAQLANTLAPNFTGGIAVGRFIDHHSDLGELERVAPGGTS
jgi:hypothetical protein